MNSIVKDGTNDTSELLYLVTEIVSTYLSRNVVPVEEVPVVINKVYEALSTADNNITHYNKSSTLIPAVPIKKSVKPDYIICLEDGKKLKMLKRHLRTTYNLTPEEYKIKWGLPVDYPMVAPNYAKKRSEYAKKAGLGKK